MRLILTPDPVVGIEEFGLEINYAKMVEFRESFLGLRN
jgi:hypothetical protein